MNFHPVLM